MVESAETRSAPALAAINAFVRGSYARLCSSNKLGWDGVYLEHHRMFPGERNDSISTHHLVVLCTSHVARGETSWEHAHFVPHSYSPVGVDRIKRNFEPMQRQVESWRQTQITDARKADLLLGFC